MSNVLTQIKATVTASRKEIESGIPESASWHAAFRHSAYVFIGGLAPGLTEGDLLAVFSQYGEVVDVHLCRDKETAKSRGFAFLAYDDQRSTNLAVDNLGGASVGGRTLRVEHVSDYRLKLAEMEGGGPAEASAPPLPSPPRFDAGGATIVGGREGGEGGAGAAPPGGEPWAGPGSLAALLRGVGGEGPPGPSRTRPADSSEDDASRAARKAAKRARKEEKKERKREKKEGKRDRRSRSPEERGRRWERRSWSRSPRR